jgi:NAD+ synthase
MIKNDISRWLKEYLENNNLKTFVVGVSGGIDSAVTSALCAMTGIPTVVVNIPLHSSDRNTRLSNMHLEWLCKNYDNVTADLICLDSVYESFFKISQNYDSQLGFANSKSRLRMVMLYQIAASTKGIVVGTGNKVEDFGVGFYTKYGDGGVDISPIADLTKTQVRDLASQLGIRKEIIEAPPTDGLWEDSRSDEDQIGASYEELEWAMDYLENNQDYSLTLRQKEVIMIYKRFNQLNSHKMKSIPVYKLGG